MAESDRFSKKRNSLVGGGLAKFESPEAADQFARRQSSYNTRVRQSIPDIRFDENGMPISTRQLQARSMSLAGGSLQPPAAGGGRYNLGRRRMSEQPRKSPGAEKKVRSLSKKFSLVDDEELKTNFTIPTNTRTGMFGTNSRWSVKPEWMKKRRSSVKEEFIEKNLSNLELLSPRTSADEPEGEMTSISEEVGPPGEDPFDATKRENEQNKTEDESSSFESISSTSDDSSDSDSDVTKEAKTATGKDENGEQRQEKDESRVDKNTKEEMVEAALASEVSHRNGDAPEEKKKVKLGRKKHKSGSKKRKHQAENGLPPRPPPPPLPVEMCDVTALDMTSSSSDEDDVTVTQYGKQRMFVSKFYHVFETSNGPLRDNRE